MTVGVPGPRSGFSIGEQHRGVSNCWVTRAFYREDPNRLSGIPPGHPAVIQELHCRRCSKRCSSTPVISGIRIEAPPPARDAMVTAMRSSAPHGWKGEA